MGIRFHCPNGHKLNVKAFLAGKKGVCPDCGVKLRIPDRSEPGLDSGIGEAQQAASNPAPTAAPKPTTAPAPVAVMTAPLPSAPMTAMAPPGIARPSGIATPVMPAGGYPAMSAPPPMPAPMPAAMPAAPTPYAAPMPGRGPLPPVPPVPPPAPPGAVDAITENPLATWFVRPPSGGQFGPARGEVMRKWLTEGRVTADSLVWREGWIDWLSATEVFPQLGKNAPSPFGVGTTTVRPAASSSLPARKPSGNMGMLILIGLAVICVLLVAVLAVVLSGAFGST